MYVTQLQELKIAAAFSDAYAGLTWGSTPMGYTQLTGDKSRGTDGHTLLAKYAKLSRGIAKGLNFQMLYLSGLAGCMMTIKTNRPDLSDQETKDKANQALTLRRGHKVRTKRKGDFLYRGGTDSDAYNFMITLANGRPLPSHLSHLQDQRSHLKSMPVPKTPALSTSMSRAILEALCGGDMLTSRANWGIQSTGVDFLSIILTVMDWLIEATGFQAWFMMSYHDELWFLTHKGNEQRVTWMLQVAHLYTWAYIFQRLGFRDLPHNYAKFSAVNIDTIFRKEVTDSQLSPSNNVEPPQGYYRSAQASATFDQWDQVCLDA